MLNFQVLLNTVCAIFALIGKIATFVTFGSLNQQVSHHFNAEFLLHFVRKNVLNDNFWFIYLTNNMFFFLNSI